MGEEETRERFPLILEEYYSQLSWLTSLITDREGKHYFQKYTLVVGMLATKEVKEGISALLPQAEFGSWDRVR